MKTISWTGTILAIVGSLLLSLNVEASKFGYIFFFGSSTLWTYVAWKTGDKALLTLNIFFTAVNLLGIYRWIL